MKRRTHYRRCPSCDVPLLSVGISVHDAVDGVIAKWWQCPICKSYHRVDLRTGTQTLMAGVEAAWHG